MTVFDSVKEEAYQAWMNSKISDPRFESLTGFGPLMKDNKTGMVYDVVEFQMRAFKEFKDFIGTPPLSKSKAQARTPSEASTGREQA